MVRAGRQHGATGIDDLQRGEQVRAEVLEVLLEPDGSLACVQIDGDPLPGPGGEREVARGTASGQSSSAVAEPPSASISSWICSDGTSLNPAFLSAARVVVRS